MRVYAVELEGPGQEKGTAWNVVDLANGGGTAHRRPSSVPDLLTLRKKQFA